MVYDFSYFPRLETERLVLRELTLADTDGIFALFGDDEVTKYKVAPTFTDVKQAHERVKTLLERYQKKTGLRWVLALKNDELARLIGSAGFNAWHLEANIGDLGYDLLRDHWGQGLMTEALRAIIQFGFEQMALNRIEAEVMLPNTASVKVLEKLGFQEEGILRQRGYWKDQYHDLRIFGLLRSDYNK